MESRNIGRPLKFRSAEELEDKIFKYFEYCDKNKKPYTVTGLAVFLDCDRDTLLNYQQREEFFGTIKRAKTKIENWIEEHSLMGDINPTVSIFNLKNNFGWRDKQEIVNIQEDKLNDLTEEEIDRRIKELGGV